MHAKLLGAALMVVALTLVPSSALAGRRGDDDRPRDRRGGSRFAIPEFDPSVAGAIAAIVAGGGLILARRRKG